MNTVITNALLKCLSWIPDSIYLRLLYFQQTKKILHLKNPQSFNEKLQWLKINNRKPIFTQMVDKVGVRDVISEKVGSEYLVPILGVWNNVDEIDFNALPNQFVLKCTHDSGDLIICRDKNRLDIASAKEKLKRGLSTDLYSKGREWPYKNVNPRVYGEVYMTDENEDQLTDYKFYCFNSETRLIQVDYDVY